MDITEQIIDESLINSWNVFLGKREGGGEFQSPQWVLFVTSFWSHTLCSSQAKG